MSSHESEQEDTLQGNPYDVLFPSGPAKRALQRSEIRSAVGPEGLKALLTYIGTFVLLASGLWVSFDTWADRKEGFAAVPFAHYLSTSLQLFWLFYFFAVGGFGWLLSGKVTKRTLRAYVAFALIVLTLLLITIGRNGNYEQAAIDARSDARRLLQTELSELTPDQGALLFRLCEQGGIGDECAKAINAPTIVTTAQEPSTDLETAPSDGMTTLRCLPDWTLSAFEQWLEAASFDRQIVALRALASCEIGALDPAAESAAGEAIEVVVVETTEVAPEEGSGSTQAPPGTDPVSTDALVADPEAPPATVPGSEAVTEALRVQRSAVRTYEAIVLGADEILSFASGPAHFAEFRFSGAAWLVLLGLALAWYRQLEIRAGARRLGPVDVQFEPVKDAKDDSAGEQGVRRRASTPVEAVFKESVIRNVPEVGAVPGSGALAPVGDLVADSDLPQKTLVSSAIEVLQTIFATKGGFTVICSVRGGNGRHSVFVRLRDTRTGNHLASHLAESDDAENAARLAGYWIAGWIIWRSSYVPSWARWSEDDAASFVRTGWEQGGELTLALTGKFVADQDDLRTVNSMILAQRAYAHQIAPEDGSNHFGALEDFARAVNRCSRYPVARYRRGAVLGTMMLMGGSVISAQGQADSHGSDSGDDAPGNDAPGNSDQGTPPLIPSPTASRLRYLFGDLILGMDAERDKEERDDLEEWCNSLSTGAEFSPEMRWRMLVRVAEWSNQNRTTLKWRWLARLRPSERFFWTSFSKGDLETDWVHLLDLERCICAERLASLSHDLDMSPPARADECERRLSGKLDVIQARAMKPDSHWQISYNLGCLYTTRSRRLDGAERKKCEENALNWLERALDRPHSAQLVQEWIYADGDLKPLRESTTPEHRDNFERWAKRVAPLDRTSDLEQREESDPPSS